MVTITEIGRPLTEEEVTELEERVGHPLPEAYRRFLQQHNGGRPTPDVIDISGLSGGSSDIQEFFGLDCSLRTSNLDWNREVFQARIDGSLMPIARDSGGCLYCLCLHGPGNGNVIYWDFIKGANKAYLVAPSFEAFLEKVRPFEDDEQT